MAILKARMVAPVIIAGVIIFSMIAASISASYSVNAVRDLPDSVSPGDSFNVTVTFTAPADKFNSIGLTEEANETANMTVEGKKEWCIPEADFVKITDSKIEILWYGPYDANTVFTVVYKVNAPSDVKEGSYAFNGSVEYYIGGEGPYKETIGGDKEVKVVTEGVFDTGAPSNPYPSIAGTHTGNIIPSQDITVHKIYTYPCAGTGGHTEYVRIWNDTWAGKEAYWRGYQHDWHNITFDDPFTLFAKRTYHYEIITGSYPQIIHKPEHTTLDGSYINCTSFVDANGKTYTDWIPAIKIE